MASTTAPLRALLAVLAAGCAREPAFIEPPGALQVRSLAGCTWTARDLFGDLESWTYDDQGHLIEHRSESDDIVETNTWLGECLAERRWSSLAGAIITDDSGANAVESSCDARGNPLSQELLFVYGEETGARALVRSYSFVQTYDSEDRLARSERWLETGQWGEGGLVDSLDYTWIDDDQPIQVVYENPSLGERNTTLYLWDHYLLIGLLREGTGNEIDIYRTFEHRKLVEEVIYVEDQETETTSWEYLDDEPFPTGQRRDLADSAQYEEYAIEVYCDPAVAVGRRNG